MIIKENGKLYHIDEETGLVTEASAVETEEVIDADELREELRTGDRVTVNDEEGTIISIVSSVYGPAIGVRFDDGSVDEFDEMQLERVASEAPEWETPFKEVVGRYEAYEQLPAFTREEIEMKMAEARELNLQAKTLIKDTATFADQAELDRVIVSTSTDLKDLTEIRDSEEANAEYVGRMNSVGYELDDRWKDSHRVGAGDDISWVEDAFSDIEDTNDADLAAAAVEMVNSFSAEQLADDEFVALASSYQHERLSATEEQKAKFAGYVKQAAADKKPVEQPKTASTDEDLDNFDASALYL
jgi:hypothetical protein